MEGRDNMRSCCQHSLVSYVPRYFFFLVFFAFTVVSVLLFFLSVVSISAVRTCGARVLRVGVR